MQAERSAAPLAAPAIRGGRAKADAERTLTNAEARHVFLARHGLAGPPTGPADRETVAATIAALGFVQVDSIATVARAHHLILYARHHRYRPPVLSRLFAERRLFEGWTHDASLIPMEFWPYWRRKFRHAEEVTHARWQARFGHELEEICDRVLAHIAANGPTLARDFESEGGSAGWWNWQPAKVALEFLWRSGRIAVCHRDGFQKVYDLTENIVPATLLAASPDDAAIVDFACEAALGRLGFASPKEIADFLELITAAEAAEWCGRNRERLIGLAVTQADGSTRPAFVLADAPPVDTLAPTQRLRILAPFDPLVRDRTRAERLFGFHYRIEIYVPQPKRRYGYYVFPILEGDRFVGRIDMARSGGTLAVAALWPEAGVRFGAARRRALDAELTRMARFAGVDGVTYAEGWLRA